MHDLEAWDGHPDRPESSGWHWIEDADGLRPLLWRGSDWPERVDRDEWQDGYAVLSARDLSRGHYYGPVAMSPRMAALCRRSLLCRLCDPQLTSAYAGQHPAGSRDAGPAGVKAASPTSKTRSAGLTCTIRAERLSGWRR